MGRYDHIAGLEIANGLCSWDRDRTMLYAVGVGAGLQDNLDELNFTTENTPGVEQQVIPGFLTTLHVEGDWIEPLGWGGAAPVSGGSGPRRTVGHAGPADPACGDRAARAPLCRGV